MSGSLVVRGGVDVTGSPSDVLVADGVVADAPPGTTELDAAGLTVLPGLLDLQVNGAAGIDITAEPERLWEVAAALPAYGVTGFLPTVVSAGAETRQRALDALASGPPAGWRGAVPLGLHFEGPMLAPSRRGAHDETMLLSPAAVDTTGWTPAVRMATVAPELDGALDLVRDLAGRGVVVAVGHTEASAEQVEAAVAAGARCATHLGNAMPPLAGRAPGPVGAVLGTPGLVAGVIADGHHLDRTTLRAYRAALGPERLLAVSDTTAALGLPDGPTRLGDAEVWVADGAVRTADGVLAGSAASLADCVRELRTATGCSLAEAVAAATSVPAGLVGAGERGCLARGCRGDLVLADTEDGRLDVKVTVIAGEVVHDVRSGA